jgi:hypothetical protein
MKALSSKEKKAMYECHNKQDLLVLMVRIRPLDLAVFFVLFFLCVFDEENNLLPLLA